MSSSIFFKFKSQKQPTQITFDGTSLSVFEVKRDIIALSKLGDGTDFDLNISSADTNEVYDDDTTQIPRSTTVVARRLPAARPGAGRAARYVSGKMPVTAKNQHRIEASNKPSAVSTSTVVQTQISTQPMTEEEKLQAMFSENKASWQEAQAEIAAKGVNNKPFFPKSTAAPDKPVPDGYICHRCGQKGHWIQACPTNLDPNFDGRPKFRRTTGIPRSFLQKVEQPDAIDEDGKVDVSKLPPGVMYTPEGDWVIARPDEASWERYQKQTQANAEQQKVAGDELKRIQELGLEDPLSHSLLDDPVKTPCCGTTYSRTTIENELMEKDFVCPNCGKQVLLDDLMDDDETTSKLKKYKEEAAERQVAAAATVEPETEAEAKAETTPAADDDVTKAKSPSPTPSKKRAAEEPVDDRKSKIPKDSSSKAAQNNAAMPNDMAAFMAQMNQMAGTMPNMQNGMAAFANPMMMMSPMMMSMPLMPMQNMGMFNPGAFNQFNPGFNAQSMSNGGAYLPQPVNANRQRQRQNRPKSTDYKQS